MVGKDVFVVAEIGANHCQKYEKVVQMILSAKLAGANAIKVQMFKPEEMADPNDKPLQDGVWTGKTLFELYREAYLPYEWIPSLKLLTEELGLFFFTSIYHPDTVDITEKMKIPAYKISSFEITWLDLIRKVASTGKPVILSTGMADYHEIWQAIKAVRECHKKFWLLHCVSKYPSPAECMNIRTIIDLSRYCVGRVGLSDHSTSVFIPSIAVSMGARIIEKHFKIDDEGLDAPFSLNPYHFTQMVAGIRETEKSIGTIHYGGEKKYRRENRSGRTLRYV